MGKPDLYELVAASYELVESNGQDMDSWSAERVAEDMHEFDGSLMEFDVDRIEQAVEAYRRNLATGFSTKNQHDFFTGESNV